MQQTGFTEAIDEIVNKDPRFEREAYIFIREALDFTLRKLNKESTASNRHVSAGEFVEGIRQYALQEFGPMVPTVLGFWKVRSSEDFGSLVFNLIEAGIFGRSDNDNPADFADVLDFRAAFVEPFLPASPPVETPRQAQLPLGQPAQP